MKPINANETGYEHFEILGSDALFTNIRIDRKTLPNGLYAYDLRDCDDYSGDPAELKSNVIVNHWGTVITKEPTVNVKRIISMPKRAKNAKQSWQG